MTAQKSKTSVLPKELPLIPLRNLIVFPNLVTPLFIGREISINALENAMQNDHLIALVTQKGAEKEHPDPSDLYMIGTLASVMQELKLPDGTAKALVEGISRIKIIKFSENKDSLYTIKYELIEESSLLTIQSEALMRTTLSQFQKCANLGKPIPQEVLMAAMNIETPGRLADYIAFHLNLKTQEKQRVLEAVDSDKRLEIISGFLDRELRILEIGQKIQSRVKNQMNKTQKEYLLKEQMKAIQMELGYVDEQMAEMKELENKINKANMPAMVKKKALKELERLAKMPPAAAETSVIRTYLEWLIGLPWSKKDNKTLNIREATKILDADHYGLEMVKKRVLEHLAVHKLATKLKGPILCFVGPPGTGKTSIGKSIAKSLGRKFIRMSVGGIRDEAEIRGHRRTYVGALPGRIIQSINQAKTRNPVIMMDEIDKVGSDFRGDPTSALLEVLDPEQNNEFQDNYLEVPFDLSDVFFLTTANILDTIPPALRDRMEIIYFPGYTEDEKEKIASMFLIPKQLFAHGLTDKNLKISTDAVYKIVREYTREAGVRSLERQVATICRQVAKEVVDGNKKGRRVVSPKNIHKYLGTPKFSFGMAEEKDEIGVATGLAWTMAGGDIISIESAIMPGRGDVMLTGQLGKVMQESAQAAVSYARTKAKDLKIEPDFYKKYDLHVHVPAGGIPKDGPSAGITLAVAIISSLTKTKVRKDVCMTGEITLRGHVLPVGGIKEKLLAAHRAGLKKVIMPAENLADLDIVPKHVKKSLDIVFVRHMDEVLKLALCPAKAKKKMK
jgi:ATP-dependent Lon protease